jgi:hypothetical protein
MVVWFVAIAVLGIVNIWAAPAILHAFNPLEAVRLATASPFTLFLVLGGVFLALTGGEALYADMGHVGRPAIRTGMVWAGTSSACPLLLRAGCARSCRSEGDRKPVLEFGTWMGGHPDGGAGGVGDHHRLTSSYLRRLFDDPAGDSDGAVPALQNHSNFERRSRPSLSSHRKL